jgi:hypothetical protein
MAISQFDDEVGGSKRTRILRGAAYTLILMDGVYRLVLVMQNGMAEEYKRPGLSPVLKIGGSIAKDIYNDLEEALKSKSDDQDLENEEISSILEQNGVDMRAVEAELRG